MQTNFLTYDELNQVYRMLRDCADRHYPLFYYKRLISVQEDLDDVHLELSEERKEWSDAFPIRGFIVPDDESLPMGNYGLERVRNLNIRIPVPLLITAGLAVQDPTDFQIELVADVGDRMWHSEGIEYDILTVRRGGVLGGTDIPLYYIFEAERLREVSADFMEALSEE